MGKVHDLELILFVLLHDQLQALEQSVIVLDLDRLLLFLDQNFFVGNSQTLQYLEKSNGRKLFPHTPVHLFCSLHH